MPEARAAWRWPRVALLALLLLAGAVSLERTLRLRFDFEHFYLDGRYVWEHGALNPDLDGPEETRRRLPFYLPIVPVMIAPLTAFGRVPAALLWTTMQVASLAYVFHALQRGLRNAGVRDAAKVVALAALLAVAAIFEAAKFSQLTFPVLALLLGGLRRLQVGNGKVGGALIGLAAVIKLLPALLIVWLVLKRRWAALWSAVLLLFLLIFSCCIVLGPAQTRQELVRWYEYNVAAAGRGLDDPTLRAHFIDHRNQSLANVLARISVPDHPFRTPWQPLALDERTCRNVALAINVVLLLGLAVSALRPWDRLTRLQRLAELALFMLGMLVLSPLVRTYYFAWALPALAVLLHCATALRVSARASRAAQVGVAVWLLGMVAWMIPLARAYGAHWLMLVALAVLLRVATWRVPRADADRDELTFAP